MAGLLAKGKLVAAAGLDIFKVRAIITGGSWSHQAPCPLRNELRFDGWLEAEERKFGIALVHDLCVLGLIILAEGLHDWKRWAITLEFIIQLRRSRETSARIAEKLDTTSFADLAFFRDSLGWPVVHQLTSVSRGGIHSALGWHKCLPICRTEMFPASANVHSELS
jgi:hypothetical protein